MVVLARASWAEKDLPRVSLDFLVLLLVLVTPTSHTRSIAMSLPGKADGKDQDCGIGVTSDQSFSRPVLSEI
ncbi:hypothetical protein ZWY2020_052447 [Hordeum vulgare]|nr:hypothetical protein ZWY2020_052447 [Hordeum vulgare]